MPPTCHIAIEALALWSRLVLWDPFVLESNQSGHPSSVSGDRIARCKRWIEREILKPSRLLIAFSMMFWLPRKKVSSQSYTYKHAMTNNSKQIESFSLTAASTWVNNYLIVNAELLNTRHTRLEIDLGWNCMNCCNWYWILCSFFCWFQKCDLQNNLLGENEGQTVLGHHGPSPSTCFGSNDRFESFLVTAKICGRAWPMVP